MLLVTLTTEPSATSSPLISLDTDRSISSPASGSGRTLSGWLAGATIAPCGQSPARANLSARQAVAQGYLTIATSGPPHTGLSPSNALARSLASRLQARTASLGSTLYRLTWKHSATPAGRWISRLRASVPRTSDSGSTGWPTPNGTQFGGETNFETTLERRAVFQEKHGNNGFGLTLGQAVQMVGWPTPRGQSATGASETATRQGSPDLQTVAGWAAPKAEDAESTGFSAKRVAAGKLPDNLHSQTKMLVGWATPATRDYRTPNHQVYADRGGGAKGEQLNNQVAHFIPGASLNGLSVSTLTAAQDGGGGGLLNPHHSRWLQGIPLAWAKYAPSPSPRAKRETSRN